MNRSIRIAVCNLQTGIGTTKGYWQYLTTGWKYALPHGSGPIKEAAQFLRMEKIDVAALCEAEGGSWRTRGVDQVDLLARRTPLSKRAFFPTFTAGRRINQGNAVCARFPVRQVKNHALPGSGEPRFLSQAAVRIGDIEVQVFAAHLSLKRKIRAPQIQRVAEIMRRPDQPTLLAGDFNVSAKAELDLLTKGDLRQVAPMPTFPAWKPAKHLDHLFFSHHFEIVSSYVFDRFRFSDHLPLVAEAQVEPAS